MEKEFVTYEQALALKNIVLLGEFFGEFRKWNNDVYFQLYQDLDSCSTDPADYEYITECKRPTYSQAFRWIRDNYGLSGWVNESFIGNSRQGVISIKSEVGLEYYPSTTNFFDSYEEAESACLDKLIEIIKSK